MDSLISIFCKIDKTWSRSNTLVNSSGTILPLFLLLEYIMGCCGGCGGEDHQDKKDQEVEAEQTAEAKETANEE